MAKDAPAAGSAALPPERRHTVSLWLILLGFVLFGVGCYLLFIEDAAQVRTTLPPLQPRSEAPAQRTDTRTASALATTTVANIIGEGTQRLLSGEFIESVWRDAEKVGVRRITFDRAFAANRVIDAEVLALSASQPEFDRTVGDYVTGIVNADRIAVGRARLEQNAAILADIERRYGVDRHILLAIWGIESNFGAAKGDRSVIRSLATLAAAETRRTGFWRGELTSALAILEQEKFPPEKLIGSWAGAMGHTQFMPSTFLRHAVDFDGDGVRDVWSSVPDALASTARYLQASGWVAGRGWGREVVLPADFDFSLAAPGGARSMTAWRILGLRPQTGTLPLDDAMQWQLIIPSGANGPAFLVSQNFEAILTYNRAYSYAIAVGTLADRIAGLSPIQASWPAGDLPMSRDQRTEMQEILVALGFDVGLVDGIVGTKTRDAIRNFQKARGLPADGHPSLALLARMRSERRL